MINKLKKVSFLFSFIRLYFRKIMTLYTYFLWVTLESMIPWKIHWASHYHFCQFWNGIVRFFQDDNIFIWKSSVFGEFIPIQFCWRKIWTLFRSQFCTGFFSIFYVTLSDQPIWQTVQNHISGHNFFICGRIWNLGILNCSVWHWWKLKCIWRVWMGEMRL